MWKSVSWYTNGIQPADGFLEVEYSAVRDLCPANTSAVNWAIKTYSLRPLVESRLRIHIIPIVLLRSSTHWLDLLTSIDYFGNLLINSRLETHGIPGFSAPHFRSSLHAPTASVRRRIGCHSSDLPGLPTK